MTSLSFPSGNAAMSAIVFLSFGALVANARTSSAERMYLPGVAAVLTMLVGASRVMLGVHWTTDVLGGWAFGAAWASMWLLIAQLLERQRGISGRA